MMFVTVSGLPFDRLVKKMDEISKKIDEDVVMQTGKTRYVPKNAEWFRFESTERMEWLYKNSRVIITHAGAGSIIKSLSLGKMPIVVPRYKKFGEHVNDHQLDLTRFLERKGYITAVYEIEQLEGKIKSAVSKRRMPSGRRALIEFLNKRVETLERGK
jgi:beta-1,4-N-acetylglucosaminyltransferase